MVFEGFKPFARAFIPENGRVAFFLEDKIFVSYVIFMRFIRPFF